MDAWIYQIILDYNGTNLINEFRKENLELKNSKGLDDDKIDVIIYAEKDDFKISLGNVLLIKMSDAMLNYYKNYNDPTNLTKYWAETIYNHNKDKEHFYFSIDDIELAFKESIKIQSKSILDISVLDFENYVKDITDNISTFFHEDLKFSREQWDPTLKSDKYLFEKPESAINYLVKNFKVLINKLDEIKLKLENIKPLNIFNSDLNIILFDNLIFTINCIIQIIQKFTNWIIISKNNIKLKIPYFCGIWNGIIEFIAGIVDMVLLALNIIISELLGDEINLETLQIRESIEEILEAFVKDPMKIIDGAIDYIEEYNYKRYKDPKLNQYQLQYNEGEDTILAIDLIVSIITIIKSIANLAKNLPKFVKWVDEVLSRGGKGAKKIINKLKNIKLEDVFKWGKKDWLAAKILKFSDDGATFRNSIKLLQREEENIFNIIAHGSKNGKKIDYLGKMTSAEDYANIIKAEGWIEGTPIRLVCCYSGSLKNGIAAKLAKILKVEVEAPTLRIQIDDFGNFVHDVGGKFNSFKP